MAGSDTTGEPEVDLGALAQSPPGLAGALERWFKRLDAWRARPEVAAFAFVVIVGLSGLSFWAASKREAVDIAELVPEIRLETTVPLTAPQPEKLVHVTGAVNRPGVYSLPAEARVIDAITAAGGPTTAGIVHDLNLAAPIADGMQVRVPIEGEIVLAPSVPGASPSGPVKINSANSADLERLVGIGPSLAAAIVTYRTEHGAFGSIDELLSVPGIGPAKLEALRDQIVLR